MAEATFFGLPDGAGCSQDGALDWPRAHDDWLL